jgi:hypothetical protein
LTEEVLRRSTVPMSIWMWSVARVCRPGGLGEGSVAVALVFDGDDLLVDFVAVDPSDLTRGDGE